MTVSGTNFGKAAGDYGTYRAGFPESIFARLAEFDIGLPDHTLIDLGTGTGTLARGFALRGCDVIGVDPDPRMLGTAKEMDSQSNVSVRYVAALDADSAGRFDADLAELLATRFPSTVLDVPHRIFTIVASAINQ